jgi:hypothetical protein
MSVRIRQRVERSIARKVIGALLRAGYTISVNDGEETTLKCSSQRREIFAAMFTTDEDRLLVHADGEEDSFGWVRFIYGNDGWDVINDYTTNLEAVLAPVNAYCERLA